MLMSQLLRSRSAWFQIYQMFGRSTLGRIQTHKGLNVAGARSRLHRLSDGLYLVCALTLAKNASVHFVLYLPNEQLKLCPPLCQNHNRVYQRVSITDLYAKLEHCPKRVFPTVQLCAANS